VRTRRLPAWALGPFLAIDTETTGLVPGADRVIEVGWARFENGQCVASDALLIDPEKPLPVVVQSLTGLDDTALKNDTTFRAAMHALDAAVGDARFLVAYHAPFDVAFLLSEADRTGVSLDRLRGLPFVDPLILVRGLDDERASGSLRAAATRAGIPVAPLHRAADDARAAGALLVAASHRVPAHDVNSVVELVRCWRRTQVAVSRERAQARGIKPRGVDDPPVPPRLDDDTRWWQGPRSTGRAHPM